MLITGISSMTGFGSVSKAEPVLTPLFEKVGGIGTNYVLSPVISPALDLTANRYVVQFDNVVWNPVNNYEAIEFSGGGATFFIRLEAGLLMTMYVGNDNNAVEMSSYGPGPNYLWTPIAGQSYRVEIEMGLGQAHVVLDGSPIYMRPNGSNVMATFGWRRTLGRPDPAGMTTVSTTNSNVTIGAFRVYRRELSTIHNLVLLGDSITAAGQWQDYLWRNLGREWMLNGHGVGYRQSREMKAAVLTPFPGDIYNQANVYADVAGMYRTGAASNWILGGIGTNDIIHFNDPVDGTGPQDGGYTAAATIGYILAAIADIRANNAGWKIAWRTVLNCNSYSGGGSYATGEAMRQAINASIVSGAIADAVDLSIDQENVFCPAASRTDGSAFDGALYNAGYWPPSVQGTGYSNNAANFDSFETHPTTIGYQALANYCAAKLAAA